MKKYRALTAAVSIAATVLFFSYTEEQKEYLIVPTTSLDNGVCRFEVWEITGSKEKLIHIQDDCKYKY